MKTNKKSKEYSRQYVDEAYEQTDLVGYSPSLEYSFDQYVGDPAAEDIVSLTNSETTGSECVRPIIQVDTTRPNDSGTGFVAYKRDFAIIPNTEGGSVDAYTYSGTMKAKDKTVKGIATISEYENTCTFELE